MALHVFGKKVLTAKIMILSKVHGYDSSTSSFAVYHHSHVTIGAEVQDQDDTIVNSLRKRKSAEPRPRFSLYYNVKKLGYYWSNSQNFLECLHE